MVGWQVYSHWAATKSIWKLRPELSGLSFWEHMMQKLMNHHSMVSICKERLRHYLQTLHLSCLGCCPQGYFSCFSWINCGSNESSSCKSNALSPSVYKSLCKHWTLFERFLYKGQEPASWAFSVVAQWLGMCFLHSADVVTLQDSSLQKTPLDRVSGGGKHHAS